MRALLALGVLCAGCLPRPSYSCLSDTACERDGQQGVCEPIGYCSFPDPACSDGRRFGELSGPYAGRCVGVALDPDASTPGGDTITPSVDAPPGYFRIGGNVSGLKGGGLVLRNNGGDPLSIASNGTFVFATAEMSGSTYSVAVSSPPTNQSVTLGNAAGTVGAADVTNIQVVCQDVATGSDPGILCDTSTYCDAQTQHCCRGGGRPSECRATSVACSAGQTLPCDDTADCAAKGLTGSVCCAGLNGQGTSASSAQCAPLASCPSARIVLCDPGVAGECTTIGAGGTCQPTTQSNMSGYHDCH